MQVSNQVIEVMEYLGQKLGIAVDFTSENVIPYAQQLCEKYIKYETATSIAWFIFGILLVIIGVAITIFGMNSGAEELSILSIPMLIVGVAILGSQISDILKCYYFPEMKIYEFLRNKINSV